MGRDRDDAGADGGAGAVSIHAPAWGATRASARLATSATRFNSRARVGRDDMIQTVKNTKNCFNSRARVGRDGIAEPSGQSESRFQFTRPRGARPLLLVELPPLEGVSIHAPAWGATREGMRILGRARFNSRARVGRDV